MGLFIKAGADLAAVLGNSDLETAGAEGVAEADFALDPGFQAAQASAQSSFEVPQQNAVKGKPPPTPFTLDTASIDDLIAPASEQPCTLGSAAMTSSPGQMLKLSMDLNSSSDLLSQLPSSQLSVGQRPTPSNSAIAQLYATASGGTQPDNACAVPDATKPVSAARPKPPPDPASLLDNDPLVTANEDALKSTMLTPGENKDGNGNIATAMQRFELQPSLTPKQRTQFEKVPSARADIVDTVEQKQFQTDPDAWGNKLQKKAAEAQSLKEGIVADSGHGDFLTTMKKSDDVYGGGQRGYDYQRNLNLSAAKMIDDLPERGEATLGSSEVEDEVGRVFGSKTADALPDLTPLQQATLYSQAAQVDLMRAPPGNAEQLLGETPANFTRDYTYLGPDKVQHFSDLDPLDRTLLNRDASTAQLYRQTNNAGTDWSATLGADVEARAAKQRDLNAAQFMKPALRAGQDSAGASAASSVDAPLPVGTVPAQNGAATVPDEFKAYVQNRGIDVSHWDTMSMAQKTESVKAAYLFNLAGDALALVPIKP